MIPIVAGLLMGAAMGGGIAALQKKNVLEGALMGAAGGALGGILMPGAAGSIGAVSAEGIGGQALGSGLGTPEILGGFGQAATSTPTLATSAGPGTGGLFSDGIGSFLTQNKGALMGGGLGGMMARANEPEEESKGNIREFDFNPGERNPLFGQPGEKYYTADRGFTPGKVTPVEDYTAANGGIIALAEGGGLETQRYERPMRQVAPEVAAYNAQLMERANAQYNINPRPGPNQVPGFDSRYVHHFGLAQPSNASTSTTTTTNQPFVPAEGSVYADLLAKKKKKEEGEKEGGYRSYESGGGDPSSNPDMDGTNSNSGNSGAEGGGGAGGGCVDPSVLVLMADGGYKTAGEIKIGDFVYAPHQDTLEYGNFEVLAADIITQPKLLIKFEDNSTIKVSDTHKFLMSDSSWKQMLHIKLGDTVQGQVVNKRIIGMEYIGEGSVVRLNIDQAHTYISEGLVSHNEKKEGGLIHRRYALGGNIHDLMQRYAMGGGIGGYYAGPDDGNRNFGGIESLNQGPQYPMQGIGYAMGGQLGGYSDGGQLLRGPGDGVSDGIPAQIGARQPARLADGEFVVPARVVSELGNGSTDAGAKRLYAMMDRVQKNRRKSVGKGKVAVDSKAYKHLPA